MQLAASLKGSWLKVNRGSVERFEWCKPQLELFVWSTGSSLGVLAPGGNREIRKVIDGKAFVLEDGSHVTDEAKLFDLISN